MCLTNLNHVVCQNAQAISLVNLHTLDLANFPYWWRPVCVVYKSQAPGICPEKDLDRNGVWVRVLILFSSMLLQAMAVLMQWQGSLKLWLYETKANFLSFVHYRERLPARRKACCANYSIHESSLKYVMDFTVLFTGKKGVMVYTLLSTRWFTEIIPFTFI